MIYMFSTGDYSSYHVIAHFEGPDDFDFTEYHQLSKKIQEQNVKASQDWYDGWRELLQKYPQDNPTAKEKLSKIQTRYLLNNPRPKPLSTHVEGFKYLEKNGFKEVSVTEVEII